jgi:hypothetical protein
VTAGSCRSRRPGLVHDRWVVCAAADVLRAESAPGVSTLSNPTDRSITASATAWSDLRATIELITATGQDRWACSDARNAIPSDLDLDQLDSRFSRRHCGILGQTQRRLRSIEPDFGVSHDAVAEADARLVKLGRQLRGAWVARSMSTRRDFRNSGARGLRLWARLTIHCVRRIPR